MGFQGISFSQQRSYTDAYFAYQEVDTVNESLKNVRRNVDAVHGQLFRDVKTIAELKLVILIALLKVQCEHSFQLNYKKRALM